MLAAAIMAGLLASPLAATPADEKSPFRFPGSDDFRFQYIARSDREQGWPFTVDEGWLACVWLVGMRSTYFYEIVDGEDGDPEVHRSIVLSTDPLDVLIAAMSGGGLLVSGTDIEDLIPMLGPFEAQAKALCDQPPGTVIGPGEL